MCGCIARVCFVLLGFTGVVVERPERGSVCAGRGCVCACVFTMAARFSWFIVIS